MLILNLKIELQNDSYDSMIEVLDHIADEMYVHSVYSSIKESKDVKYEYLITEVPNHDTIITETN